MIIDGIFCGATTPGTSGTAASVASPGTLTLQPDADPVLAYVITMFQATSGFVQITSPDGHDTTRGWRSAGATTTRRSMLSVATPKVGRGETLSVTIAGSTTAGDIEVAVLAVAYPTMSGGDFISPAQVRPRHITSIYGSVTPNTTIAWASGSTLAALQDTLRANARYAVLGAQVSNEQDIACAFVQGPDTGWYRVPIPVYSQDTGPRPMDMRYLAEVVSMPLIPVIQSGNKSQTYLGLVANENGTARNVNLILAQL